MSKYPNTDKVKTKMPESCKVNMTNLPFNEGISQIYKLSELIIHKTIYDGDVFRFCASSCLDYGVCPYCAMSAERCIADISGSCKICPFLVSV